MPPDPLVFAILIAVLLAWSIGGYVIFAQLAPIAPAGWPRVWLTAFCGPVIWALRAREGVAAWRMRVLNRFHVAEHACGGSGCRHHDRHDHSSGIHVADRLANQPSIR